MRPCDGWSSGATSHCPEPCQDPASPISPGSARCRSGAGRDSRSVQRLRPGRHRRVRIAWRALGGGRGRRRWCDHHRRRFDRRRGRGGRSRRVTHRDRWRRRRGGHGLGRRGGTGLDRDSRGSRCNRLVVRRGRGGLPDRRRRDRGRGLDRAGRGSSALNRQCGGRVFGHWQGRRGLAEQPPAAGNQNDDQQAGAQNQRGAARSLADGPRKAPRRRSRDLFVLGPRSQPRSWRVLGFGARQRLHRQVQGRARGGLDGLPSSLDHGVLSCRGCGRRRARAGRRHQRAR